MLHHLKRLTIAAAAVLAVSLAGSTAPASAAGYWDYLLPPYGACGTAGEGDMSKTYAQWTNSAMCIVNAVRTKAGLQPYTTYANLLDSAYKKASDISVCQPDVDAYVTEPDGRRIKAVHRACGRPTDYYLSWPRACVGTRYFSENVYIGSGALSTARAAVSWWLNSDQHRPELLSPTYTAHGLMYSGPTTYPKVGSDSRIWVHHMGHCG